MIRSTLIAALLVLAPAAHAADAAVYHAEPVETLQRIDPAKTLLLIKRIKSATGSGLVVS